MVMDMPYAVVAVPADRSPVELYAGSASDDREVVLGELRRLISDVFARATGSDESPMDAAAESFHIGTSLPGLVLARAFGVEPRALVVVELEATPYLARWQMSPAEAMAAVWRSGEFLPALLGGDDEWRVSLHDWFVGPAGPPLTGAVE